MRRVRAAIARIAAFAIAVPAFALMARPAPAAPVVWNGPLSRSQAQARVEQAGFDVRMAIADADAARGETGVQAAALTPQIGLSGNAVNGNLGQLGMPVARQTYVSFFGSVPLWPVSGVAALHTARDAADASARDLESVRIDAAFIVIQAYDAASLAAQIAWSRKTSVEDEEADVRVAQLRVRVGKAPAYELVRARAALAGAEQSLEDARAQSAVALDHLKTLLDLDMTSTVALDAFDAKTVETGAQEAVVARALVQRPDVLAAAARLRAASDALAQAEALYAPTASLSAQTYAGHSSPALGSSGSTVGVSVSVPLFDGGLRPSAVHQARALRDKAQADYERRRLTVTADVADAWAEIEAARANLVTAEAGSADARENLRVARLRQQAGKGIQLEVLDALALASSAREMTLTAQARFDVATAALHHAAADPSPW